MQLHYQTGDLNGNDEATLNLWRFNSLGGDWENKGADSHDLVNHSTTKSGITEFSPWTLNSTVTTAVKLENFAATAMQNGGVALQWQTGLEVNNLGFNIYREENGERVKINPSLIAGTALMVGSRVQLESGLGYTWRDDVSNPSASYWLEDVDLNGAGTWNGPYGVNSFGSNKAINAQSPMLNQLNFTANLQKSSSLMRAYPAGFEGDANSNTVETGKAVTNAQPTTRSAAVSRTIGGSKTLAPATSSTTASSGRTPTKTAPISSAMQRQWQLAGQSAIKIAINKTGWYQVNALDLMTAGLGNVNPTTLQMFVGGVEVPIKVNSADGIHFGSTDSIEFYGAALDTPTSDRQIYWLTAGSQVGKRIPLQQTFAQNSNNPAGSFQYTVERKDRSVYFSSLRNGDAENWFGSVIASQPVSESITIRNHDQNAVNQAQVEIALQGVTVNAHSVSVMLNGSAINTITFNGMDHQVTRLSIPESLTGRRRQRNLVYGAWNSDVSLVDYIRVTYAHTFTAENNSLRASQTGNQPVKITGFTSNQIRAIDVANAIEPVELEGSIDGENNAYSMSIGPAKRRNLIVFTPDQMLRPLSLTANQPSGLNMGSNGADFVIITSADFAQSIQPLVSLRQSQGYQVSVVDIENVYDEFSYGVHTPQAVKDFLDWTYTHWAHQPQYVMLTGSATLDPRNYTGLGNLDFVPTKLIDTSNMETASDDWFVDFNNDGIPQMAIGRLPVRTAAEATNIVNKIMAYDKSGNVQTALLVSDLDDGINFKASNSVIGTLIPHGINLVNIVRGQTDIDAKTALMDQLTQGNRIINYAGHGSVNLWRGSLLTDDDMQALSNQKASPLLVTMTCLNGYFQDPRLASLGESLLKVNQGGVVSVWASSGMTNSGGQQWFNQEFFKQLFGNTNLTIGQAIKTVKSGQVDNDVRRTWILFGDPTMKIRK